MIYSFHFLRITPPPVDDENYLLKAVNYYSRIREYTAVTRVPGFLLVERGGTSVRDAILCTPLTTPEHLARRSSPPPESRGVFFSLFFFSVYRMHEL